MPNYHKSVIETVNSSLSYDVITDFMLLQVCYYNNDVQKMGFRSISIKP